MARAVEEYAGDGVDLCISFHGIGELDFAVVAWGEVAQVVEYLGRKRVSPGDGIRRWREFWGGFFD